MVQITDKDLSLRYELNVANQYRAVNLTIPSALSVEVINGTVITADNARVINSCKTGDVQATNISVTDVIYKVGNYDGFSKSKTIALKINGCSAKGECMLNINENTFPVIVAGYSQKLTYFAKVFR